MRGNFLETDNAAGAVSVTDTARFDLGNINNIDGSAVTLHAGTHSDVTIQGVSNNIVTELATDTIDDVALAASARAEMWNITVPEMPVAAPSATPSALTALSLLNTMSRNQVVVDGSAMSFYNDAGTNVFGKPVAGTSSAYTESEMVSG